MRVTVDEARDRRETRPVELLDVAPGDAREVAHRADRRDRAVRVDEDVPSLDDLDLAQRRASKRRARPAMRGDLREVADQQPTHSIDGRSSAISRASSIASG